MIKTILSWLKSLWVRINKAVEPDPPSDETKDLMPSDGSGYEEIDKEP